MGHDVRSCSKIALGAFAWLLIGAAADWDRPAANGDRVPDFSEAGYGAAGDAIPIAAPAAAVEPSGDVTGAQDRARIQAAIDRVAALPIKPGGLRGAVTLSAGKFVIDAPLLIQAGGVVLRGSEGKARTTIVAVGGAGPAILVGGAARLRPLEPPRPILADYIPVGATTIPLASTKGLAIGDLIALQRPFTPGWIAAIGMDRIPAKTTGTVVQWGAGRGMTYIRRVTAVSPTAVELDAPVVDAILKADGASLCRAELAGAIEQVGVEHLDGDGTARTGNAKLDQPELIRADTVFVAMEGVANGWVRDLHLRNFASLVRVGKGARDVTVENVQGVNDRPPWWGVPPAAFDVRGQRVLVRDGSLTGARILLATTQANVAGPTVFKNLTGTGPEVSVGPHQRWATGTLYDNVRVSGEFLVANRGNHGSGQGWPAANTVIWNSAAVAGARLEQPPGAHLWTFGLTAQEEPGSTGSFVSNDRPVQPESLFDAQLARRMQGGRRGR